MNLYIPHEFWFNRSAMPHPLVEDGGVVTIPAGMPSLEDIFDRLHRNLQELTKRTDLPLETVEAARYALNPAASPDK